MFTGKIPVTDSVTATEETLTGATPTATDAAKSSDASSSSTEVLSPSTSFANRFFVFAIFGIAIAAFIWIGGARYLARFLPSSLQARYSKLAADEDLVK